MNQLVRKNQKAGSSAKKKRRPILIVHLDDGAGRPLCGLPRPWPSEAHRMASVAEERDVCLVCSCVQSHRPLTTAS